MGSYRFKVVLTGDEAVGKTSIIQRFINNAYTEMYKPTLGFQISVKVLNYLDATKQYNAVIFSIWDVAGQGVFNAVRRSYYTGADGFLLIFDLTRRKSFDNVKLWMEEIRSVVKDVPIILVGNKVDLTNQIITPQDVASIRQELQLANYFVSSAATGRGVEDMFLCISDLMIKKISKSSPNSTAIHHAMNPNE